jgi:hypothetical protein
VASTAAAPVPCIGRVGHDRAQHDHRAGG